jgi:hypothetical protein
MYNLKGIRGNQSKNCEPSDKNNQPLLMSIEVTQHMQKLHDMKIARIIESVVFFFIIVSLWQYIVNDFNLSAPKVSAIILNVFAIIGFASNIGQIVFISEIDYSAPVKNLRQKIYNICLHRLQLTKLVLLSVPFYISFLLFGFDALFGFDLYKHLSEQMVMFYVVSTAALFGISVWLLSKLTYKNITTPWVKWTIGYIVGDRLLDISEFLNDTEIAQ